MHRSAVDDGGGRREKASLVKEEICSRVQCWMNEYQRLKIGR
jgi:hypothetical protein